MHGTNLILTTFLAFLVTAQGYQWPSIRYEALETLLYEGRRSDGSNLASTQHPCKNRGSTKASIGAEWLRLAYHDVATHDAQKGTGGLDASIAFELDQTVNKGLGMVRSLEDFSTFSSKYISRADVIAVGTTFAAASCGGPILRFRGGRVDATKADSPGVPEPDQDLATHTRIFERQGFSPEEMIGLVACGHTLGGVRSSDHPEIVPPGPDPSVDNFVLFDDTRQFDNVVVTQFLDGTTKNPLVMALNTTFAADSRIFGSDGGATMRKLASSDTFASTCGSLLERMLEVVPADVTLTDEIKLLPAKVNAAQLTIEKDQLVFKLTFRLTQAINTTVNSKRVVSLLWCDRYGKTQGCDGHTKSATSASKRTDEPDISPVTLRLGYYFAHYSFVVPIDPEESISMFWLSVDEGDGSKPTTYDNEGTGYPVQQDNVLYIPTRGSVVLGTSTATARSFHLVSAVKRSLSPSRVYMSVFDSAMPHYEAPLQRDIEMTLNDTMPPVAGYAFYSGHVEDLGAQLTVDMHVIDGGTTYTEEYMQTYFLDSKLPYTPPTAVIKVDVPPPQSQSRTSDSSHIWSAFRTEFGFGLLIIYMGFWIL